ncbi:MAG: prepilin-type N-terminal cleavage/methylation domain-containing protein [Burkholderiales bacterium]|nr:prepilin-type N-terminal cleavage/methylation domain-containing protein [Burkholderiales bacterium]
MHRRARRGFTLIELLVVLAILALLMTVAVPRYFQHIQVAKEEVLKENLRITRDVIDKYFSDTGHYPNDLTELVSKHYLRSLPYDPIIETNDRWIIIAPQEEVEGQLFDLKSSAPGTTHDGVPYGDL